jgi:metallo-beta-lactamase family protein
LKRKEAELAEVVKSIDVNAEVISLEGFSAHADRDGLLDWVRNFDKLPGAIFLVHGEKKGQAFLKNYLEENGYPNVHIVQYGKTYELM